MDEKCMHSWIVAPSQAEREAIWLTLTRHAAQTYRANCHKNLRGPYTGCGTLLRQIVPEIYQRDPELVKAHAVEILSVAPELKTLVSVEPETLSSLAIPAERTRFYGRTRTLRLAHGLIDFLRASSHIAVQTPVMCYFENAHAADSLDREFLEVLLRRLDARAIHVVVSTTSEPLSGTFAAALATYACSIPRAVADTTEFQRLLQSDHVSPTWQRWLLHYSARERSEWQALHMLAPLMTQYDPEDSTFEIGLLKLVEHAPPDMCETLVRSYISADGTSESVAEALAYQLSDREARRRWHDERADELEQLQQWSLYLGAIPYHRALGQNRDESAPKALQTALDYCIDMGFYEEAIALAQRGRSSIDWEKQGAYYWAFTSKCATSLAALERAEEARALYNEARSLFSNPSLHMQAAYATAMLDTRPQSTERRNFTLARGWINEAIAIAQLLKDPKESVFSTVFHQNGLALIETCMGRPQEALRLITEGLARLERELDAHEHQLHRSALLYNRAQVYVFMEQLEQALDDYTAVIAQDPYYSEYYFDRGNLYRRMGRDQEALADYECAIRYSPPYAEAYYKRAGVLSNLGRDDEALADYTYVLDLEPEHRDALSSRASILYKRGDPDAAIADLCQALALSESAALFYQRGLAYQAKELWQQAIEDFTRAISLSHEVDDTQDMVFQRGQCCLQIGHYAQAKQDFAALLQLGNELYVEEIRKLEPVFSAPAVHKHP